MAPIAHVTRTLEKLIMLQLWTSPACPLITVFGTGETFRFEVPFIVRGNLIDE